MPEIAQNEIKSKIDQIAASIENTDERCTGQIQAIESKIESVKGSLTTRIQQTNVSAVKKLWKIVLNYSSWISRAIGKYYLRKKLMGKSVTRKTNWNQKLTKSQRRLKKLRMLQRLLFEQLAPKISQTVDRQEKTKIKVRTSGFIIFCLIEFQDEFNHGNKN